MRPAEYDGPVIPGGRAPEYIRTGPDVADGAMVSCRDWPGLPEWSRAFMPVLEKSNVPA